jgi:quercetin dioxygenase-like cupin family protein
MAGLETNNFNTPDETRPFADKGAAEIVALGEGSVMKARFEPGWHWTEHLGPIAGTETCESPHLLYVLTGRMRVRMNDGTEGTVGPNEVARIEPGHDAWVVGDEACTLVDFGASPSYAKPATAAQEQARA